MSRSPLVFHAFGSAEDPLVRLGELKQAHYLRRYLADLGATAIVEEPTYFDRDYLAEFAAFYATSTRGYHNHCRRLHFFSESVDEALLTLAASGDEGIVDRLRRGYLGFVVLRPIAPTPLGRTVLAWYPEHTPSHPRVMTPSRWYECHLVGITLWVYGVAWQQQDSGVGSCATIALWSALHSSAFDDHHAIPTTAQITRYAHRKASLTSRLFPSDGLNVGQLCEAIKEAGLEPIVLDGDIRESRRKFTRERFNSSCAALLRCGYPLLILAHEENDPDGPGHAVCVVGFREPVAPGAKPGKVALQDGPIQYLYIHDDNLGPNVRFSVENHPAAPHVNHILLRANAPKSAHALTLPEDPSRKYPRLVPSTLIAAVHEELRTTPDALHHRAKQLGHEISVTLKQLAAEKKISPVDGVNVSLRFARLHRYLGHELETVLGKGELLGKVRMTLAQDVDRMSLFVGVVRVGLSHEALIDFLFDTTDNKYNLRIFCNICFTPLLSQIVDAQKGSADWGTKVEAFE